MSKHYFNHRDTTTTPIIRLTTDEVAEELIGRFKAGNQIRDKDIREQLLRFHLSDKKSRDYLMGK